MNATAMVDWCKSLSPPCRCVAPAPPSKLVDPSQAADIARSAREAGQVVVFTNGCFDLLHEGHLATLESAHRLGDLLIVAVNSDASVRALKGTTRPIQCQHVRVGALAGVPSVDFVVSQTDLTPNRLLVAIRPDILVKGATTGEIIGADLIGSLGGRPVRLDRLVPGVSTTAIIEWSAFCNQAAFEATTR